MLRMLLPLVVATAAFAAPTIVERQVPPEIISLEQADSAVGRNQILAANGGNASFVFDFTNPPAGALVSGPAGNLTIANGQTAPFLVDIDASLAVVEVGPCGLILPHLHPRGDEFIIVTEGEIFTQFISETGAVVVTNTLKKWGSTLFPKGSIHLDYNPTCEPAAFVAAFNSNDPGVTFVAASFLSLEDQLVVASLGGDSVVSGADLETIRQHLPPPVAVGVAQCLKQCKIQPYAKRSMREAFGK